MTIIHTFELPDAAFELLKAIDKAGLAEYRDTEFETLEEFQKKVKYHRLLTDDQFLLRNFSGTFYLIEALLKFNLVDCDDMPWHTTFTVSDIGKQIIEQNS